MYTENEQFLLLLDYLKFSKTLIHKFIERFDSEDYFNLIKTNDERLVSIFKDKDIKQLKTAILSKNHEKLIQKLNKMHILCIFFGSEYYPSNFTNIKDAPIVLYTIGDVELFHQPMISIIGTRKPTKYGKDVVSYFVKGLAKTGIVTVSDLAYGIDGLVASETLSAGGKTIAILAGGLDSIYPSNHTALARQIVKNGGLLVTEHLPGVKPIAAFFVERNRLLASISEGLLLIEAAEGSNTMATVSHALNFGKELFVVPGNITSVLSVGTNKLISEIPDAFTISPNEIAERFGIVVNSDENQENKNVELTNEESIIIDILYESEMSFDYIQEKTKINPSILSSLLTSLEINGLIKKLPGNYYVKN